MGLREKINELQKKRDKKRLIKEINKCKEYNIDYKQYINTIILRRYYLQDEQFLNIIIDEMKENNIDDFKLESIITNISIDVILNNKDLFNIVVDYYTNMINNSFNNSNYFNLEYDRRFKELTENDKIKKELIGKLDINTLGEKYYKYYLEGYSYVKIDEFICNLLNEFGFKFDDEYVYEFLINHSDKQYKLLKLVTINENIVDRLYQYKFELLKNWIKNKEGNMPNFYISTELVPSSDNEFANYWRGQSIELGEDALDFVFDKIKDYNGLDIFSEKSREQIYNKWFLANENWIKYYDDVQKEFNESFNTFSGRLFDNKGIPLEYLFSNKYDLHLSHEILEYNYEGGAKYRTFGTSYEYSKPDYKLIRFLINNIDRMPEEYRFIFEKLKELENVENVELREKIQMEFLLIMTGGHRIIEKKYRLYDENDFNDNFYDALFYEDKMEYIDYYAPDWKKHLNENEHMYMEKYKNIYDFSLLNNLYSYSLYKNEKKSSNKNLRELVNYYFSDGKPNNNLAMYLLFDIGYRCKISEDKELYNLLDDKQRNYYNFLEKVNFDNKIRFNSSEIEEYFDDLGKPTRKLALRLLLNVNARDLISESNELLQTLTSKEKAYFEFLREIKFDYRLNLNKDEIEKNFDSLGKPTREMALSLLLNVSARDLISESNELLQLLTSKEKAYFEFLKEIKYDYRIVLNIDKINEYFDSFGLTDIGVEHILNDYDVFYSMNQEYFKSYYENNYNISVFQSLLKQMDNCYYYLIKFLSNTLNIKPPINEDNIKNINKKYCLDLLESSKMMEIIKYVFYSDKESKDKLSKIMYNNEFEILIKLFCKLSINQNIEDLRKMVNYFNDYKELCINMYNVSEFNESEKTILYSILINGDISAKKIIKNREDLNNYSKIKYDKNNEIINTSDIMFIKSMIFSNLFNIDLTQVRKILDKYGEDTHFSVLMDNIHDDKLKEILNEYDAIIGFISSIYNSEDLDSLKTLAIKINENYKINNLDVFFDLWNNFSKMDSDIMKICGEEINEKITNFNELLNTKEEDIPIIDGEKAFNITDISVDEDFIYDNKKIEKGTNVKMIELNGLPFVSFGHVLNAYGSGGKLSDFNHPRLIGRTHLCLTGIDDNYYNLVNRIDKGIDYVQVIFDNLPSESLVIASSMDVGSRTEDNYLPVSSSYPGTYQPIRKVITETYHGDGGYNEYVYYRQYSDNMKCLRPSAILIRGEKPTESEIQAAAYLNVPLVKINKEKYPKRTKEEMELRDKELESFYKNLYEKRKQKSNEKKVIELQNLRRQILNLSSTEDYIGRKIG